jgi:hypothetical protein
MSRDFDFVVIGAGSAGQEKLQTFPLAARPTKRRPT